jgi:protein ImuA
LANTDCEQKENMYDRPMQIILDKHHQSPPHSQIMLLEDIALKQGCVHECAGRARRSFALMVAARTKGPVIWISPSHIPDRLNPTGMRTFVDPGRFVFAATQRKEDILWSMEEALRSGSAPLVIADLQYFPSLTPVRRLHLAAETGSTFSSAAPIGLLLTPDNGGAQGVETRWRLQPYIKSSHLGWSLSRTKARQAPPATWQIVQTAKTPFQIAH